MVTPVTGVVEPSGRGLGDGSEPRGRRIGVFGGTFDPPHIGHLVAAVDARQALDLDVVLLVVANVPWQKVGSRAISPAEDRLAMVEAAAVDGTARLEVSDIEMRRGGRRYTADTLADLPASRARRRAVRASWATTPRRASPPGSGTRRSPGRPRSWSSTGPGTPRRSTTASPGCASTSPSWRSPAPSSATGWATGRSIRYLTPPGVVTCIVYRGLYR